MLVHVCDYRGIFLPSSDLLCTEPTRLTVTVKLLGYAGVYKPSVFINKNNT